MQGAIPQFSGVKNTVSNKHLDPALERRRRHHIMLSVVPRLLNRHLAPLLGLRRFLFILRLFALAPRYRVRFARPADDGGMQEVKRTFLLVGVLYNELCLAVGESTAFATTHAFLFDLACAVQRQAYLPPLPQARSWERFHEEHAAQFKEGFIRNNENDGIVSSEREVRLHIVRCRFYEAFRDMGNAALTEAFCRSDEVVFNEYSAGMRFHRGLEAPNTIARGGQRCVFVYERLE